MTQVSIWSNGGGMQSSAIAGLIVLGKLPKPDLCVIADTGREHSATWAYLDAVTGPALAAVGVTVHRVRKEDFATVDIYGGASRSSLLIPAFIRREGAPAKLPGFCSNEWKRRVIQRWARARGVSSAALWIGISTDEIHRAYTKFGKWTNEYPLIDLGMSRADCQALISRMGWPEPPRSACWMCPNHRREDWLRLQRDWPQDWAAAVAFEREIQGNNQAVYLAKECVPLSDLEGVPVEPDLFDDTCTSGMCFV